MAKNRNPRNVPVNNLGDTGAGAAEIAAAKAGYAGLPGHTPINQPGPAVDGGEDWQPGDRGDATSAFQAGWTERRKDPTAPQRY